MGNHSAKRQGNGHPPDVPSITVQSISTRLRGKHNPAQTTSTRPTGKQSAALKTSTKPTGNQSTHKAGRPAGKRGVQEEAPRGHKRRATAAAATRGDAEVVHLGLTLREYQPTNDCSQLAKLIEVTCTHLWPGTVIKDAASFRFYVAQVKVLDEAMSAGCTAWGEIQWRTAILPCAGSSPSASFAQHQYRIVV